MQSPTSHTDRISSQSRPIPHQEAVLNNTDIEDYSAPLLLGVDVARYGADKSVIAFRQGMNARRIAPLTFRKLDTMQLSEHVAQCLNGIHPHCPGLKADAALIDGIGVGSGVVDRLKQMGFMNIIDVNSASASFDKNYNNKRTEMYARLKKWLEAGGQLPHIAELYEDLSSLSYAFDKHNRISLMAKDDMRKSNKRSPDIADAIALTFAEELSHALLNRRVIERFQGNAHQQQGISYNHEYDA